MAMGGPIVIPAAIVVARSLFLPEPHTHKRAASSVETTMDLFTIKAVFLTPCDDVTSWFGRVGQVGGRKKPRREDSLFISLVLGHLQLAGGLVVTVKRGHEIKCCPIHQE